jgi:hypothetical protein
MAALIKRSDAHGVELQGGQEGMSEAFALKTGK